MRLTHHINDFMGLVAKGKVEIYNEFSLQHELGIFLRDKLPDCKVEFERNVNHFALGKKGFVKKEIDISITDRRQGQLLSVVELKYPRNGQVPEQMFSFCKDISFVEQLVASGFRAGTFVAIADDPMFYSGQAKGIYGMFRAGFPINGIVQKPTGAKDTAINIRGTYEAKWHDLAGSTKYCLIEADS